MILQRQSANKQEVYFTTRLSEICYQWTAWENVVLSIVVSVAIPFWPFDTEQQLHKSWVFIACDKSALRFYSLRRWNVLIFPFSTTQYCDGCLLDWRLSLYTPLLSLVDFIVTEKGFRVPRFPSVSVINHQNVVPIVFGSQLFLFDRPHCW